MKSVLWIQIRRFLGLPDPDRSLFVPVLRIRIRIRIHMFLGLPDPLVRGVDPDPALDQDPDPSIIMQK
jgi:hypothetical protein